MATTKSATHVAKDSPCNGNELFQRKKEKQTAWTMWNKYK